MRYIDKCHWEITKRCNLKCIHCIVSGSNKTELNTVKAKKVLAKLHELGCKELYITGGEPLIRDDIFEILKKAKEYKFIVGIITNGILINNSNIKYIKLYVDKLGISLEGSNAKLNDKIRGTNTFKKILRSILLAQKYQIPLTLYITISKINEEDIQNILQLANNFKINTLRINEVSLRGKAYKNRKILFLGTNNREEFKTKLIHNLFTEEPVIHKNSRCALSPKVMVLSPTGYIYPCIEILQRVSNHHFGNILQLNKNKIRSYQDAVTALKYNKCPYEDINGGKISLCLNNNEVPNCPVKLQLCRVRKLLL